MLSLDRIIQSLYEKFLSAPISDLEAAKILLQSKKTAQSLFYLQQAFEKGLKAAYLACVYKYDKKSDADVYELIKAHRHNTRRTFADLFIRILDIDIAQLQQRHSLASESAFQKTIGFDQTKREKESGGFKSALLNDASKVATLALETIEILSEMKTDLEKMKTHKIESRKFLLVFPRIVNKRYLMFLKRAEYTQYAFYETNVMYSLDQPVTPNATALSYTTFYGTGFLLCICLTGTESFGRYPSEDVEFENLEILSKPEYATSCQQLYNIVEGFQASIQGMLQSLPENTQ